MGYLKKKGYFILEKNYKTKFGEIDIIAQSPENIIVFVEVKTLNASVSSRINPEDNMTTKKMHNFKKMSEYYFNKMTNKIKECRADVITILLCDGKTPTINHYENV